MSLGTLKLPSPGRRTVPGLVRSRTEPVLSLGRIDDNLESSGVGILGVSTSSNVQFNQQLDKVKLWLENWDHKERCEILEALLKDSHPCQHKLLWTVLQPALHRDFMYTARKEFPEQQFVPISSFTSRKLRERQVMLRENTYHRIESAHLQRKEQFLDILQEVKLPQISSHTKSSTCEQSQVSQKPCEGHEKCGSDSGRLQKSPTLKRSVTWSSLATRTRDMSKSQKRRAHSCQTTLQRHNSADSGQSDVIPKSRAHNIKSAPPCVCRSVEMPVRRHIQEEHIPISQDTRQASSLSSCTLLNHRQRRKHKENMHKSKSGLEKKMLHVSVEGHKLIHWYLDIWDDVQRNEFLSKILYKLDPRQHYYISGFLCVQQHKDFISHLPTQLALRILSYLSPRELLRASKVCTKWKDICSNNDIWKQKCIQGNIAMPAVDETTDWKKLYYENRNVKDNWNQGKCSVVNCKGHTDRVLCVTFDERRMATGGVDKMIRIWDLDTGDCIQTLQGHFRGVWCIKFFTKHLLISGSYDCSIKIWNLRDGSCVRTLLGHEGSVWAIVRKQSRLASGSQDRTARIWDASRCQLIHTLRGHHGAVYCIDMDDSATMVLTGSSDKTVRLWSVETGVQWKVVYVTETAPIMAISYSHNHFACSYGGKITLYRYNNKNRTAKVIRHYYEHRQRIESLLLQMKPDRQAGNIISGGRDGELKYWNINREGSVQSYRAHQNTINCVYCDAFRIATASYDNKIKIWDFRPP